MTKKLQRQAGQVFNEDGDVIARNRVKFSGAAELNIDGGSVADNRVVLFTDHIYNKEALDELIAELLFLKEEWEQHPVYLGQEQVEDMNELAIEDEADDLPEDVWDEPAPGRVNPFEEQARVDWQRILRNR